KTPRKLSMTPVPPMSVRPRTRGLRLHDRRGFFKCRVRRRRWRDRRGRGRRIRRSRPRRFRVLAQEAVAVGGPELEAGRITDRGLAQVPAPTKLTLEGLDIDARSEGQRADLRLLLFPGQLDDGGGDGDAD